MVGALRPYMLPSSGYNVISAAVALSYLTCSPRLVLCNSRRSENFSWGHCPPATPKEKFSTGFEFLLIACGDCLAWYLYQDTRYFESILY